MMMCDECGCKIDNPKMEMVFITKENEDGQGLDDKTALHYHEECWFKIWETLKSRSSAS